MSTSRARFGVPALIIGIIGFWHSLQYLTDYPPFWVLLEWIGVLYIFSPAVGFYFGYKDDYLDYLIWSAPVCAFLVLFVFPHFS